MVKTIIWEKNVLIIGIFLLAAVLWGVYPAHGLTPDGAENKVAGPDGYHALMSRVREGGTVKILAKVSVPYGIEATMSRAAVEAQRAAIGTTQNRVLSELSLKGLEPLNSHKYTYIPYLAMTVDRATLETLLASNTVSRVHEDIPVPANATPGWDIPKIGADTLHTAGVKGSGIAVAVLDTGVDKTHAYLSGAVVSEACYSSTGSDANGSWSSICPGGVTSSTAAGSAMPYSGTCPAGKCDHGTHVAGTVAGRSGVAGSPGPGVAPEASLIAMQVFTRFNNDYHCKLSNPEETSPCALTFSSDYIKGLERVYALRDTYTVAAANMSLGGGQKASQAVCDAEDSATKDAIDNLRAVGIATVVSSANSGYCGFMGSPACISTAVSVGATDSDDAVASYSNSASFLNLLAPGSEITSSIPGGTYASLNGTSMAAPHVAGAWALLKSKNTNATVEEVLAALISTGTLVTDTGKCSSVTKPRINVSKAYNALVSLYAYFPSDGLYKLGGTTWTRITNVQPANAVSSGSLLIAYFTSDGLYGYDGAWTRLTTAQPQSIVGADSSFYAYFASDGLYRYNGVWTRISTAQPSMMTPSGSALYAYFPSDGLYKYDGAWTRITTSQPASMIASSAALYAYFPSDGLYRYDSAWSPRLTSQQPSSMVIAGLMPVAYFAGDGLYAYTGTWTLLTKTQPQSIAGSPSGLYAYFAGDGIYRYGESAWTRMTTSQPASMAISGPALFPFFASDGFYRLYKDAWTLLTKAQPGSVVPPSLY